MEYTLERSLRRTLMIRISRTGEVIVKAPKHLSQAKIDEFVSEKKAWILKNKNFVIENTANLTQANYSHGEKIVFLGEKYRLFVCSNQKEKLLFSDNFYLSHKYIKNAEKIFKSFYKEKCLELVEKHISEITNTYNFNYGQIKITSGKNRLGTCSSLNNLSFSWRIILAPEFILRYIVCHELAHTVHHNHSSRFWNLVEELFPEYKKAKKWLRDNLYALDM